MAAGEVSKPNLAAGEAAPQELDVIKILALKFVLREHLLSKGLRHIFDHSKQGACQVRWSDVLQYLYLLRQYFPIEKRTSMIQYWLRTVKEKKIKSLPKFRKGCWIDVHRPSEEELLFLAETFHLEMGHLQDALDPYEVPRVEREGSMLYFFVRVPWLKEEQLRTDPLLLIIGPTFFATVATGNFAFLDRLRTKVEFSTTQKVKCLILISMDILTAYQTALNTVARKFNTVRRKDDKLSNEDVLNLIAFEQVMNEMLGALVPMNTSLETLLHGKALELFEQDKEFVEDVFHASGQLILLTQNTLVHIRNTREAYTTIMTNNLNDILKLFTSLTVILTLPTIIFSFYGMNVALPLDSHPLAFFIIGSVTTLLVTLGIILFRRRDWL